MSVPRKFTVECRDCDESAAQHHEFNPFLIPATCVCPPEDWRAPDSIPDVCSEFVPMDADSATCLKCEHEDTCHAAAVQS